MTPTPPIAAVPAQPDALRIADEINGAWLENADPEKVDVTMIQAELRRLHAENRVLKDANDNFAIAHDRLHAQVAALTQGAAERAVPGGDVKYALAHADTAADLLMRAHERAPETWRGWYDDALVHIDIARKALAASPAQPAPEPAEIENLRKALQFYADGEHFIKSDDSAWDTVSGEPQNYWCDEAGTATVEDGSIARLALVGQAIKFEDEAQPAPAQDHVQKPAEIEHVAADVSKNGQEPNMSAPAQDGERVACEEDHPTNRHLFKVMCATMGIELGKDRIADALKKVAEFRAARAPVGATGGVQEPFGYWFTDDPKAYAMPGSGFKLGSKPPQNAINMVALYDRPAPAATADALTVEDAELLQRAVADFEDCGETDVPDAALRRFAAMGYLECVHYHVMPAAKDAIDAALAAQQKDTP
jgi:hypothetical protein